MATVEAQVEEVTETQVEQTKQSSQRFRWDKNGKIENLVRCLANYKSQMVSR